MKKQDLQKIIREEIRNVIKEAAASKAQQQAAGIALSVKRGDAPASKLKDAGKAMVKMSEKELEKIAGTKHDNLPKKVKKEEVDLTEATGMNVTVTVPSMFIKAFKKFMKEHAQDSEKGDTYYIVTPGKEAALYSRLFSEWVKINFNALDEYELMDNFDSDLEVEDEGGFAAILAKNGLLTKKIK